MALRSTTINGSRRLAEQLQALSEVTESLTYRLLDLEERFSTQERELQALSAEGEGAGEEDLEARLRDARQRLEHIEELLAGGEPRGRSRMLEAVGVSVRRPVASFPRAGEEGEGAGEREGTPTFNGEHDADGERFEEEFLDADEQIA